MQLLTTPTTLKSLTTTKYNQAKNKIMEGQVRYNCCLIVIKISGKYCKVNSRSWVNHKQWNKTLENTKPQNTEAAMSKWASNDCPQRTKQQCTSKPPLGHYKTTIAASWSKMGFIFFWESIHIFSNELKKQVEQNVFKESSTIKTRQILVSAGSLFQHKTID